MGDRYTGTGRGLGSETGSRVNAVLEASGARIVVVIVDARVAMQAADDPAEVKARVGRATADIKSLLEGALRDTGAILKDGVDRLKALVDGAMPLLKELNGEVRGKAMSAVETARAGMQVSMLKTNVSLRAMVRDAMVRLADILVNGGS
jgi:hypothetical protein